MSDSEDAETETASTAGAAAAPTATPTCSTTILCLICLETYKSDEEVLGTNCGHVFHKVCLLEWQSQNDTCPQCRVNAEKFKVYLTFEDSPEVQSKLAEVKTELETFVSNVDELHKKLDASDQNTLDMQILMQSQEEELQKQQEKIQELSEQNELWQEELLQIRTATPAPDQSLAADLCATFEQLVARGEKMEIALANISELQHKLDEAERNNSDLQCIISSYEKQLDQRQDDVACLRVSCEILEEDNKRMNANNQKLLDGIKMLKLKITQLQEQQQPNETTQQQAAIDEQKIQELEQKLRDLNYQLQEQKTLNEILEMKNEQLEKIIQEQSEWVELTDDATVTTRNADNAGRK